MLKDKIITDFEKHKDLLTVDFPESIGKLKRDAYNRFLTLDFPHNKLENWRFTDISKLLGNDYTHYWAPPTGHVDRKTVPVRVARDGHLYRYSI